MTKLPVDSAPQTPPTPSHPVTGEGKGLFIQTYGCQMNVYDSGKMHRQLQDLGYHLVPQAAQAALIVVNTCAVREHAAHKVYSLLGRYTPLKHANPKLQIVVCGCVAQQEGEKLLREARCVDIVLGTDNLFELPELLPRAAKGERIARTRFRGHKSRVEDFIPPQLLTDPIPSPAATFSSTTSSSGASAAISALENAEQRRAPQESAYQGVKRQLAITKGCNKACTFCVVPATRGREVSRTPADILREARHLVAQGARELTLLGQNVNSYRAQGWDFVALLEALQPLEGLERLRYTSPHPRDLNPRLAEAHATLPKLCEHLHLPFQSGANGILQAMRRMHTIETYLAKISMVRALVPHIALSADVIVGFPGESEADFQATLDVLRQVRFDQLYAFKYSSRPRTVAATLPNQLPEAVKAQRLARLLDCQAAIQQELLEKRIGRSEEVLIEGPHPRHPQARQGRSRGNRSVTILDCQATPGQLIEAHIHAARPHSLVGRQTPAERQEASA